MAKQALAAGKARAGLRPVGLRLRLRRARSRGTRARHRARPTSKPGSAASAWPTRPGTPTRRRSSGLYSGRPRRSTPAVEVACHFHNTYGLGLANCYAAMRPASRPSSPPSAGSAAARSRRSPAATSAPKTWSTRSTQDGCRTRHRPGRAARRRPRRGRFFGREMPGCVYKTGPIAERAARLRRRTA